LLPARYLPDADSLAFWSPWLFWIASALAVPNFRACCIRGSASFSSVAVCYMFALWSSQMNFDSVDAAGGRLFPTTFVTKTTRCRRGRYKPGRSCCSGVPLSGHSSCWLPGSLWFTESLPWSLRWVRYISVVVHAGTALLLIGNFMIHIYMGVLPNAARLQRDQRDVSLAFASVYHPGWYKEIVGLRPLEMTILSAGK